MADADCPAPAEPCLRPVCVEGGCQNENATAGVVPKVQTAGDCAQLVCDGRGSAMSRQDPGDKPADDGNDCTEETCEADGPQHSPLGAGAACGQGGVCNGKGLCGVCLPATVRCEQNAVLSCGENGQWSPPEVCSGDTPVCDESHCARIGSLAVGDRHACVRLDDGKVRCWGSDGAGQSTGRSMVNVPLGGASAIVVGQRHRCALGGGGTAWCWGANGFGQIGDGTRDDRPMPVQVAGLKDATAIAAGDSHTCVRLENGTVECWGKDDKGQLGGGGAPVPPNTAESPRLAMMAKMAPVKHPLPGRFGAIALGGDGSCAIGLDGRLQCWGQDPLGGRIQAGGKPAPKATGPAPKAKPVAGLKGVAAVALGGDHACAALQDGSVTCWGDNEKGQLGDGSAAKHHPPAKVKGLAGVAELALGRDHTCARLQDGSVLCWGSNAAGQLGDGGKDRRVPGPVPGIAGATAIVAGGDRTCALLGTGAVMCWGDNTDGALGDGTAEPRPGPTAVTW